MAATARRQFAWDESYKLGIRGVDEDHFVLVSMIGQLEDAVYCGQGRTTAIEPLQNLIAYVKVHFSREERLMKNHQYPHLGAHRTLHDGFARKVVEFQDSYYQQGSADLADELLGYLKDWLVGHIQRADRRAAAYLLERGVR